MWPDGHLLSQILRRSDSTLVCCLSPVCGFTILTTVGGTLAGVNGGLGRSFSLVFVKAVLAYIALSR